MVLSGVDSIFIFERSRFAGVGNFYSEELLLRVLVQVGSETAHLPAEFLDHHAALNLADLLDDLLLAESPFSFPSSFLMDRPPF